MTLSYDCGILFDKYIIDRVGYNFVEQKERNKAISMSSRKEKENKERYINVF